MIIKITTEINVVGIIWPAPYPNPIEIAKNKYISSSGSLIGVLNRTMDNAPTRPNESASDDFTIKITRKVINDNSGNIFDI